MLLNNWCRLLRAGKRAALRMLLSAGAAGSRVGAAKAGRELERSVLGREPGGCQRISFELTGRCRSHEVGAGSRSNRGSGRLGSGQAQGEVAMSGRSETQVSFREG